MKNDEIIRMAREAGFEIQEYGNGTCHVVIYNFQNSETDVTKELERFAALVAAHVKSDQINTAYQQGCEDMRIRMEGYRIGLAEMREKCAKAAERFEPDEKCSYVEYASAAIRAIKFEGDTGFRPVSEMIAKHKQAEQEPVAWMNDSTPSGVFARHKKGAENFGCIIPLYAAPVSIEAAVLAEREACAKVADGELMNTNMLTSYPPKSSAAWNIAAAIRARGNNASY